MSEDERRRFDKESWKYESFETIKQCSAIACWLRQNTRMFLKDSTCGSSDCCMLFEAVTFFEYFIHTRVVCKKKFKWIRVQTVTERL